jgi:hypothetical protein
LALLIAVGFTVLRSKDAPESGGDGGRSGDLQSPSRPLSSRNERPEPHGADRDGPGPTRSSRDRSRSADPDSDPDDEESPVFPVVLSLLADESLPSNEVAAGLLEICRRSDLSEPERFEALAHGMNVDFSVFAAIAQDPNLPSSLAQRFADELANRNHQPAQQVAGFLDLLKHADEEIRAEAAEKLAFLIENEPLAESPAELEAAAKQWLEQQQAAATDESSAGAGPEEPDPSDP